MSTHDTTACPYCYTQPDVSTSGGDVEALAKVLADLPTDPEHYARIILASDWLAARTSAAATRAADDRAERIAGAIEAADSGGSVSGSILARAAAIARETP